MGNARVSETALIDYRLYRADDFAPLYAIEQTCFHPPLRFGRPYMRQLVESPSSITWVAGENDSMAGFAIAELNLEPNYPTAYIPTLEVCPELRRCGIGRELLHRIEQSALAAGAALLWLHVDAENDAAVRLYRAHGFELKGRHEHYYARSRAAEVYAKVLVAVDIPSALPKTVPDLDAPIQ